MKDSIFIICLVLAAGIIGHIGNLPETIQFLNSNVHINGYGDSSEMKMWKSLVCMASPFILIGVVTLLSFLNYKTKKARYSF